MTSSDPQACEGPSISEGPLLSGGPRPLSRWAQPATLAETLGGTDRAVVDVVAAAQSLLTCRLALRLAGVDICDCVMWQSTIIGGTPGEIVSWKASPLMLRVTVIPSAIVLAMALAGLVCC